MKLDEKQIRTKLAYALGSIAEDALMGKVPFDEVVLSEEFAGYYYHKYCLYSHELDSDLRMSIFDSIICLTKCRFVKQLTNVNQPINKIIPVEYQRLTEFDQWIKSKESGLKKTIVEISTPKGVLFKKVVKGVLKHKIPSFVYDSAASSTNEIVFSKDLSGNTISINIDKGTNRGFISFGVSFANPEYYVDMANFFSGGQSCYRYNSNSDLEKITNLALDILQLFLSPLESMLRKLNRECKIS